MQNNEIVRERDTYVAKLKSKTVRALARIPRYVSKRQLTSSFCEEIGLRRTSFRSRQILRTPLIISDFSSLAGKGTVRIDTCRSRLARDHLDDPQTNQSFGTTTLEFENSKDSPSSDSRFSSEMIRESPAGFYAYVPGSHECIFSRSGKKKEEEKRRRRSDGEENGREEVETGRKRK